MTRVGFPSIPPFILIHSALPSCQVQLFIPFSISLKASERAWATSLLKVLIFISWIAFTFLHSLILTWFKIHLFIHPDPLCIAVLAHAALDSFLAISLTLSKTLNWLYTWDSCLLSFTRHIYLKLWDWKIIWKKDCRLVLAGCIHDIDNVLQKHNQAPCHACIAVN